MGYQFSMERKSVAVVVTGFVLVGALLFSAGLLMGVHFGLGNATLIASTPSTPPGPNVVDPAPPGPTVDQTISRSLERRESAIPNNDEFRRPRVEEPLGPSASSSLASNDADKDAANDRDEAALRDPLFWVQVGEFRSELEAERLIDSLESRGYTPAIYEGIDTDQRLYFAVRIGSFNDREEATQTAADYEKREKRRVVVRSVNSL